MQEKRFVLWDLPTRLFHWLLVLAVAALFVSGELGGNLIDWHGRIGIGVLGLLAFRLAWGVLGSTYARFAQFFPTPARIRSYLKGEWQGEGHNPLGALSVFALLGLVAAQAALGLFANDDIAFNGPLFDLVGRDLSSRLTGLHHVLGKLLLLLIGLHVAAIVFYARVKKKNLLLPMLTGRQQGEAPSATGGGLLAVIVALAIAAAAIYGASGAWLPEPPPPPPAAETPNW